MATSVNPITAAQQDAAQLIGDFRNGTLDDVTKGAGSSFRSAYFDLYSNLASSYIENKMNWDNTLKMWNMNNEYNTPKAQMERLLEAGLNPNLAYSIASSGNASGSAPQASARIGDPAGKMLQVRQQNMNMVFGALDTAIDLTQKVLGTIGQSQQLQQQAMQLKVDKSLFRYFNPSIGAGTSDEMIEIGDTYYSPYYLASINRFMPSLLSSVNNLLTGQSLRSLQGSNRALNQFKLDKMYPLRLQTMQKENSILDSEIGIRSLQKQMLQYQNDMLQMLPPEVRTIYTLILQPLLGGLHFNHNSKTGNNYGWH